MAKKLGSIKKKAWSAFSRFIRIRDADESGNCKCITCGAIKPIKEMQAGHFIGGRNNAVLFSEFGVHAQCYGCNIGKHGNAVEYFVFMEKTYGREEIELQRNHARRTIKYTYADYLEIYNKYNNLCEELT
jgi:Bacteriophage Lambda NinG protein